MNEPAKRSVDAGKPAPNKPRDTVDEPRGPESAQQHQGVEELSALRPGWRAWLLMLQIEWKLIVRDTAGMVIPIGLPLLLMVMNGIGQGTQVVDNDTGATALEMFILPIVLTMVISTIALINVPTNLATYRKEGALRRLAVTPASPIMVLATHLVVNLLQMLAGVTVAVTVAVLAFDTALPELLWGALGVFALITAAMYGLGMVVAAIAPTTNFALATGLLTFFALLALGGGFGSQENYPEWLLTVGEYTPYGAGMDLFAATWIGGDVELGQLLLLAGTAVVGALTAVKLFRWT